jgi:hypothetical protein
MYLTDKQADKLNTMLKAHGEYRDVWELSDEKQAEVYWKLIGQPKKPNRDSTLIGLPIVGILLLMRWALRDCSMPRVRHAV